MPQVQDRAGQLSSEELPEAPMTGPFGGVQSELPLTEIEALGFADCRNLILRLGAATARPGFTALPAFPSPTNEPIQAVPNFFNANGQEIQCVITPTRLLQFISGGWVNITGPGFTPSNNLFSWDVLNQKLCFSQGADIIWQWDGISGSYTQTSASAPVASRIAEIGDHLVAVSPNANQTYLWSGIGDPTDWTSFSSGSNKLVNNLGPINGLVKLGQYGFGFHQFGIVQIIPTGIGVAPFAFQPIVNASQGTIAPFSLDHFDDEGIEYAVYLGIDNVYVFNGSSVEPIGDRPLGNGKRFGARTRILADVLVGGNLLSIYGFVTYSIAGNPFRAYWLVIPNVSVWVYNFDEGNWTVFNYANTISSVGVFFKNVSVSIAQLVGAILSQSWSPATLLQNNPFDGFLLGFNNGVAGYVDFSNYSEQPCSVTSGKLIFGDRRHLHTVKKFRLSVQDKGATTYTVKITNELGVFQSFSFSLGSGSGDVLNYVQAFTLNGLRFQYTVSFPSGQPGSIVEMAPIYDIAGEQRGGIINN